MQYYSSYQRSDYHNIGSCIYNFIYGFQCFFTSTQNFFCCYFRSICQDFCLFVRSDFTKFFSFFSFDIFDQVYFSQNFLLLFPLFLVEVLNFPVQVCLFVLPVVLCSLLFLILLIICYISSLSSFSIISTGSSFLCGAIFLAASSIYEICVSINP